VENFELLVALSLVTLTVAVVFGIWQRIRVSHAKKVGETSAMTKRSTDDR